MAGAESEGIEFRLLGPVEAVLDGRTLALGGRRQRALLALLLLEPGRSVSSERLVDELWNGSPPAGAATTVRTYVSKLRSVLGAGAALTGGASGYALDVPPELVDARRFERLVRAGREALERRAARRAAERLRAGLDLWRGRPFGDLGDEGALRLEADRLEELRLAALEDRLEADLELGQAAELVDELEALVHEHPYRERLWRQLMLALYRAERQADALAAYRRARTTLDETLGLEPGEELKALEQAILRHDVPLARPPEERHNLPAQTTSFVGREAELAECLRLGAETRLLTLTGVGGVGKTRLALEAARRALGDFPDGVYFVDFSALADPALVPAQVATALDVRGRADAPVLERLAARLTSTEASLVLDNCEHLRVACAELVHGLLTACPRLRIMATSREALGVPGEVDYPVPPLAEAETLFVARAREVRPTLREDDATTEAVARICRDLDGLPLAIELAAARAKALSLDEIAARLADRFRFLVSWRRLTAARHRTLREAMDWSYELLGEEEQMLLARLSVFAGGFTLGAASTVCLGGADAADLIGRLVDASLAVPDEHEGEMRYRLLETVRQYAAERLDDHRETEEIRRRHVDWCVALAEQAAPELTGERQAHWFALLDAEHDNLRAALAYLMASDDRERLLLLVLPLTRFWYVRGHVGEGRRWLGHALALGAGAEIERHRRALTAAASFALLQADYPAATELAEQALEVARRGRDERYVANALSNLGAIVLAAGDGRRAADVLEDAVALARRVGDERIAALAINNLGDVALTVGDYGRAEPLFEESLALLRARGDTANVARALFNLAAVALRLGRLDTARDRLADAVSLAREAGDKEDLAWCLEGFAGLAAAEGDGERSGLLLGAAAALLDEMGAGFKPFERKLHDATEAQARVLCGQEAFADAKRRGSQLPLAEALEHAVAEPT